MSTEVVVAYQSALIYSCLDDFTASSALHNLYGGLYGTRVAEWKQASVDFLYRNLVAGLIEVSSRQPIYREMSQEALCRKLGMEDPLSSSTKTVSTLWIGIYFVGTDSLEKIVERHGLLDWKFFRAPENPEFMREISDIYRECGVELERDPLLSSRA